MEENSKRALFDSAGVQVTCRRSPNSCGESGKRISSRRSFCYPGLCQVLYVDVRRLSDRLSRKMIPKLIYALLKIKKEILQVFYDGIYATSV